MKIIKIQTVKYESYFQLACYNTISCYFKTCIIMFGRLKLQFSNCSFNTWTVMNLKKFKSPDSASHKSNERKLGWARSKSNPCEI